MTDPAHIHVFPPDALPGIPADVESLLRSFGGPSWIEQRGHNHSRRRLVATLLHGNEPSGVRAVHAWLRSGRVPAVDTVFYIGSIRAALAPPGFAHRFLPGERDANRCYGLPADDVQGRTAGAFTDLFRRRRFEAVIDIHNTTGHNPVYGVGFGVDPARLRLTTLFGEWYMNSNLTLGTLVEMTSASCPSIAVETGRAGDRAADVAAWTGLERFLTLDDLGLDRSGDPPPLPADRVLNDPVRVSIAPQLTLAFGDAADPQIDLTLRADIDRHNFECIDAQTAIGWLRPGAQWPLVAHCADALEHSRDMFELRDGTLYTRRPMVPVMMTTDPGIARSDCLFYAMAPAAG
ncbi:MAG: hypothetical protein PHP86_11940 [Nevskiales bacterium]|nr:hypothetical protein [Nevskiales bacterium]